MGLTVDFVGVHTPLVSGETFVIGREGDLIVDDNQFLHRQFLTLSDPGGVWLLTNVGDQLAATVSDPQGRLEAFLGPGAVLPIVFEETTIRFTAGPTTYEVTLRHDEPAFRPSPLTDDDTVDESGGAATIGRIVLTLDQQLLILALAEAGLKSGGGSSAVLPTSTQAARRLDWTVTKFNRKLDNVCDKLSKLGVRGLQGDAGRLASNRRARLVEYALAVRLVTRDDLAVLDAATVTSD